VLELPETLIFTKVDLMNGTRTGKVAIYIVLLCVFGLVAEGCHSSKKCGCGTDLNNVWKPNRRYR